MATLNSHEDLDAWRVATELKEWVFRIIKRPAIARHFKFCDDIGRSARSAPANLAEDFWRYRPRDNAKFVRNALGSLGETQNHLRDAFTEKYIDEEEYDEINALNERALRVTVGWHTHLMSCPERQDAEPIRTARSNRDKPPATDNKTAKPNNQNGERISQTENT